MITIKTAEEIERLREGGRRHARILERLASLAKPGVPGSLIDEEALRLIREGGDTPAFLNYRPDGATFPYPSTICFSINDEVVHGLPQDRILRDGDIVAIDLGLIHEGLVTDAAITVPVGAVSPLLQKLMRATEEALFAGIHMAYPGNTVGHIGAAIEAVADKYSFGLAEGLAGHGVGYAVHEDPYVPNTGIAGEGPKLRPGMVIAIEPMLVTGKGAVSMDLDGYTFRTVDGGAAAHFEHTIVITERDPLIVTARGLQPRRGKGGTATFDGGIRVA
jgi:methionyl aminopeptidase